MIHRFDLYERFVQSPETHLEMYVQMFYELTGRYPKTLREDFCGTFLMSAEWVKRNRLNRAVAIDLDPSPLQYGLKHHFEKLTPSQKKRLKVLRQNVIGGSSPLSDLTIAGNFSFNVFKTRRELVRYFRSVRRSLKPKKGVLLLEAAGGPGLIHRCKETKSFSLGTGSKKTKIIYEWDQRSFDPITHAARFSIHFGIQAAGSPRRDWIRDAFTYDWRLWTLAELKDALRDAGFKDVAVFWETTFRGSGTGEYLRTETGDNAYSWIAYVAGVT